MDSSIPIAVLMCHAPIVLPEVGGRRSQQCAGTTVAMEAVAARLVATDPDVLVILSPHTPRHRRAWGLVTARELAGDFTRFGAPQVRIQLPVAQDAAHRIATAAEERSVQVVEIEPGPLDHGAAVPLHFVTRAGWAGPTVLIALPWSGTESEAELGEAIADAARASGQRWAVLASGDMSHRLIPGAPAGFHPRAQEFDDALVDAVTRGDYRAAASIDAALRDLAAEDAVDTVTVAAAAVGWRSDGHETLGYEGPFGVGYMEAVLYAATG